jgi:hypothetical protein
MADESTPDRIRLNAEGARVALGAETPARIARAVAPVFARFTAERLSLPLEAEPSTFVVVQRAELSGE